MKSTFDECVAHTLEIEGGYVNDPNDRGGETKYGISKRSYPNVDIASLTFEKAKEIYKRDYWYASQADKLPELLRLAHFDCAVHCGVGAAVKILQEAVHVTIDGRLGQETLSAVHRSTPRSILEDMLWLRARLHSRIARDNKAQRGFLAGWMLRVIGVRNASLG